MSLVRIAASVLLAALPSGLKVPMYRWLYGYQIGNDVKIGFGAVWIDVGRCRIGDHVRIGRFNLFYHVDELNIADHTEIGFMNLFRGGRRIDVGAYATILRFNVFNSILRPDAVNPLEPVLELGAGVVVTTGHWLDFTDRITIGPHTIIGGRSSSFWTHNRQRTRGISVGARCYIGSEARIAPGVEVPALCIVALGSVLMGQYDASGSLIAGNPARVLRSLNERDLFLVTRVTRNDIPPEVACSPPARHSHPLSLCEVRLDEKTIA